jgi:hypothetical protein
MFCALFAPTNKPIDLIVRDLIKRLKKEDTISTRGYLSQAQDEKSIIEILNLTSSMRSRLCPNYFVGSAKEALICLVNPLNPELFILAQIKTEGAKPDIRIEIVQMFLGYSGLQIGKGTQ